MRTKWIGQLLLAALIAGSMMLTVGPAAAQDLMTGPDETVGMIPGTNMSRDEFRARAYSQLTAVALNAIVYRIINDQYPATYYELRNSTAWNLEVTNMFNGRRVNAIYFEPQPEDLFSQPAVGLGFPIALPDPVVDYVPTILQNPGTEPSVDNNGNPTDNIPTGAGGDNPNQMMEALNNPLTAGPMRVNPGSIKIFEGGDIFYYCKDTMLQLVMYAPDGTYLEQVYEVPNANWENKLMVGGPYPDCVHVAEVLLFATEMLPQFYNMVQFMGDREPVPVVKIERMGANERVAMSADIGVTLLNPLTKDMIQVFSNPEAGHFVTPDGVDPMPLMIALRNLVAVTHEQLMDADPVMSGDDKDWTTKGSTKPSKRPPLGGKR